MAFFGKKPRPVRRRINRDAWMTLDGDFAARRCVVLDISDGGARLKIEDPRFMQSQFKLKFSRADQGRRCRVAWRKGTTIGVEFV